MRAEEKKLRVDLLKAQVTLANIRYSEKEWSQWIGKYVSKAYVKENFTSKIPAAEARVARRIKALLDAGYQL